MRESRFMKPRMAIIVVFVLGLGMGHSTAEGSDDSSIALVVAAGRPLRVSLDRRERVRGVGQPVTATLVEPVYSYDRIVLPAGTKVLGRVETLEGLGKSARLRAALGGDFTPLRHARLQFNTLVLPDGNEMRIAARVKSSAENISLQVAKSPKSKVGRAREEAARKIRAAIAPFKEHGKWERLKNTAIAKLPYHPQYLSKGAVYTVELLEPLNFGEAAAPEWAPAGALLPPEAILAARLITALDSSTTPRGTPIRAVLTQPLFSADQRLILPEGTELQGEVTFAKHAKTVPSQRRVTIPVRDGPPARTGAGKVDGLPALDGTEQGRRNRRGRWDPRHQSKDTLRCPGALRLCPARCSRSRRDRRGRSRQCGAH